MNRQVAWDLNCNIFWLLLKILKTCFYELSYIQHSDCKVAMKNGKSFSATEDDISDVYPLKLRLSVMRETNSLGVRICKKENAGELFRRAYKIFSVESELLHIWDFCGQTTPFFTNERNEFLKDCHRLSDHDFVLELQVYGLSDSVKCKDGKKDEIMQYSALGEIALAFGDLLWKLWAPGAAPVAPRLFKSKLARFAPQFSGYNQHDSQELLAFLLDGLHEDLNRVKCKPYIEAKDGDGCPDGEVADEYWWNHLARNDSIIVDVCQGQYKSTLVCPVCKKVSLTFDPFMYLSLPLPSTTMRTMTLTVVNTNGGSKPYPMTLTVPKYGKCEDLIKALGSACSLRADETLLVAEIYNN